MKGKEFAARLTGISTPIGGVSWTPPVDERDKARRLLVYLGDRRALYNPFHMEIGHYVVESVLEIRKRLTADAEDIKSDSVLRDSIKAMQAACRRFLDQNQQPRKLYGWPYEAQLHSTLGELRALFGIHIARIACAYDLELVEPLVGIVPPETDGVENLPETE